VQSMLLLAVLSTAASALQVSPLRQLAANPPAASSASRLELRDELLSLLPPSGTGPQPLEARAFELVKELELLEAVPASSGFLELGLRGAWSLRGTMPATDETEAEPAAKDVLRSFYAGVELVELIDVGARFDAEPRGAITASCQFRVLADDLVGRLEVDLTAGIDPDRVDTIHVVTNGRKLLLPRAPSCEVPAMMEALHANLPAEFLGDEGVRLGLQTTYLDETLRITRCTTRSLATTCAVHLRLADDAE